MRPSLRSSSRKIYGTTAQSAFEKLSPARYGPLFSESAIHASSFRWCASASATNSESSPCSMTLRLYSARRLSGALPISARHASGVICRKAGRNAVANVRMVQELCTYSSISLLHAYAVALTRLLRHQRWIGKCIIDVIEDQRGFGDRCAFMDQCRHYAVRIEFQIRGLVLVSSQRHDVVLGRQSLFFQRDANLLGAD